MLRDYMASLPPTRFPNIVALVDTFEGGADERLEFGMDVLISGLAANARS